MGECYSTEVCSVGYPGEQQATQSWLGGRQATQSWVGTVQANQTLVGGAIQTFGHKCLNNPNRRRCAAIDLDGWVRYSINQHRLFYIGYTSTDDTRYICDTLPKSAEWRNKFKKWVTYYAKIDGTGITERGLIADYRSNQLCVNKAGGVTKTGFVYILIGQVAS